jgi:sugar lactone lactonase YvrE
LERARREAVVDGHPGPASRPSCIAFGGPEMNLLLVTPARDGLKDDVLPRQPSAGNLFVYMTDITGLPDADFIFG